MNQVQQFLASRNQALMTKNDVLAGARVYLSGPMDFVASREEEKKNGWRVRVEQFLREFKVDVYNPWNKPEVAGMPHYGKEDEFSHLKRERWTFEQSITGDIARAGLTAEFWPTLHIDLRMVDYSDFIISYVPTNIYSVGTVNEIVLARQQYKPVLFVSPPIVYPALAELEKHLAAQGDRTAQTLLAKMKEETAIQANEKGIPSSWYMALIDSDYFFDGFGFAAYRERFGWEYGARDAFEEKYPPRRPLLPYLEKLDEKVPPRYDLERGKYVENPDWLFLDEKSTAGAAVPAGRKAS
ncbi:MAG TPA: hypothetical protein VF789_18160 [Thermoanaerobaculia bacterium]